MVSHNEHATRAAKLRDLPLVRRLIERGLLLDAELSCTREIGSQNNAIYSSLILPQRSQQTLVTRSRDQHVIGQYRLKPSEHLAQITFIAPHLEPGARDTAWLHMLDAMASEAGKRGVHMLAAEIDEDSPLFQTMRTAGFAVYARQSIWRRASSQPLPIEPAVLVDETDADGMDIQLLYCNIVPRLVQPIAVPSRESTGLVYRQNDRIMGYVAVTEGKSGIYLIPYLHPDVLFNEAAAIIAGAISRANRGDRLPVYVCVRRFQDWLEETLMELGFDTWGNQAVMVRHITAGIRQAGFTPLAQRLEAMPIPHTMRPPTTQVSEPVVELSQQE